MAHWLCDVDLNNDTVRLQPLSESHRDALVEAASDGTLSKLWHTGVPCEDTIDRYIDKALREKKLGKALAFVVIDNKSGRIIGSTRFCNAVEEHQRLEIGFTWYAKTYQRTSVNSQCKLMLLTHAFESLAAIAVEFRTHWHNHPSRNAITRLGAKQDGVLRNHMKEADGAYRDTVVYSIINSEWPTVRKSLTHKLNHHKSN